MMGPDGPVYAHHPPLIYAEAVVSGSLTDGRAWVIKLPALLGSVAAIGVLYIFLTAMGLSGPASLAATAATTGSAMFLVYGGMLNMEAISLPLGLAVLWLWQRARQDSSPPLLAVGLLAILLPLSSWQGLILGAALGVAALYSFIRGSIDRRFLLVIMAGFIVGATLSAWWLWFANGGSYANLANQLQFRSSGGDFTFGDLIRRNLRWFKETFPAWTAPLAPVAALAAILDRRTRWAALLTGSLVAVFALALGNGSFIHDYWNYWLLVPLAIGLASFLDNLGRVLPGNWFPHIAVGLALVSFGFGMVERSPAEDLLSSGAVAGELVATATFPPGQAEAWYFGNVSRPLWLEYYSHRPPHQLDVDMLNELDVGRDQDLVLVSSAGQEPDDWTSLIEAGLIEHAEKYGLVTVSELRTAFAVP